MKYFSILTEPVAENSNWKGRDELIQVLMISYDDIIGYLLHNCLSAVWRLLIYNNFVLYH